MIDYVKILVIHIDITQLLELPFLEFKTVFSEKTGELSSKKVAEYKFCKITVFDNGIVLFTGSIHKFLNELEGIKSPNHKINKPYKGFNGNDFNLEGIIEVREHLKNLFDCRPENLIFQNIELGVNIKTPFNPKLILDGLILHKGAGFEYRFVRSYAQSIHSKFIFKIYDKGLQYGMSENTLRVELKITKMKEVEKIGIKTFADINEKTLEKSANLLLSRWNEILLFDSTVKKKELTKREKEMLSNYSNPRFWINELKPNHRDRHKKRLIKIISEHSDNIQKEIYNLIEDKCVIINRLPDNKMCVINNHSNIEDIDTQTKPTPHKKCPVTRIDISMQHKDSFLLSHTGLKYLYNNNRKLFEEVKQRFLYPKYKDADFQTQIREIAHCIRDKWRTQLKRYPKHQMRLFKININ